MDSIAPFHTADTVALARRGFLPMTPVQALMAGFELEPATIEAQDEASASRPYGVSRLVGDQFRQGFRVGNLNLMIRYEDGSELTEMPDVYRLPNAPAWFCGMANLHGMLIPVFDLSSYLGVDRDAKARRMLLVLSRGADAAGVVIDGMPERLRWSEGDQVDTDSAPHLLAPHLRCACLIGERLCFDLECDALLDALEHAMQTPH